MNAEGIKRILRVTVSRFERFDREREGADKLIRTLEDQLGIQIEYDPQSGFLSLPKGTFIADPSGEETLFPFGRLAASLDLIERKNGIPWEEAIMRSLKLLHDFLKYAEDHSWRIPSNFFQHIEDKIDNSADDYLQTGA